jgi:hypothetical protein
MVRFFRANDGVHKLVAVFNDGQRVPFGAFGYQDFTTTGDLDRKKRYLKRHRANEDWNNPKTAGALSRWLLWNKPTLEQSIHDYIRRFHMQLE